jgi:AraC family transcriptional regulator of adaptative response/methylated-DNA-[protein]-cysteine methyltransferase
MLVYALTTTGIYCRYGCPSRRPRPEHIMRFRSEADAEREGFRACLRCLNTKPDPVRLALARLDAGPATLADLGRAAGLSPFHLQRAFKKALGVSPLDNVRLRKRREAAIPARRVLRIASAPSPLGRVYVAATRRGVCDVSLGTPIEAPKATFVRDPGQKAAVAAVVRHLKTGRARFDFPLDVRGTAFEALVWKELRKIAPGTTTTYAEIARRIGKPRAVRAVAGAVARNRLAVVVPCHRVVRKDGSTSGYRWGVERKRRLLEAERR